MKNIVLIFIFSGVCQGGAVQPDVRFNLLVFTVHWIGNYVDLPTMQLVWTRPLVTSLKGRSSKGFNINITPGGKIGTFCKT